MIRGFTWTRLREPEKTYKLDPESRKALFLFRLG